MTFPNDDFRNDDLKRSDRYVDRKPGNSMAWVGLLAFVAVMGALAFVFSSKPTNVATNGAPNTQVAPSPAAPPAVPSGTTGISPAPAQ